MLSHSLDSTVEFAQDLHITYFYPLISKIKAKYLKGSITY